MGTADLSASAGPRSAMPTLRDGPLDRCLTARRAIPTCAPTVSRLLPASAEPASSASISRSSLLSVLLRQTAQATPAMQSRPTR